MNSDPAASPLDGNLQQRRVDASDEWQSAMRLRCDVSNYCNIINSRRSTASSITK
jgi:hypothetical protein